MFGSANNPQSIYVSYNSDNRKIILKTSYNKEDKKIEYPSQDDLEGGMSSDVEIDGDDTVKVTDMKGASELLGYLDKLEEAKMCVTALAAILVASKYGKAEEVWEEFSVKEAMSNFDNSMREILDEKQ